jgi:hypothetical protein
VKIAFIVCNDFFVPQLMELLRATGIDYYTRWDNAKGKGSGTTPHLGAGGFAGTNTVMMIAFEHERPLETLIEKITAFNATAVRKDDRVRLFQLPLDRIV